MVQAFGFEKTKTAKMAEEIFTLAEVLERLKGRIGRTKLIAHINAVPRFAGAPTHRRNGVKYLFTEADIERIIDSLACPEPTDTSLSRSIFKKQSMKAAPSDHKAYERAVKRLHVQMQSPKGHITKRKG